MLKVTHEESAPKEAIGEAIRRNARDGIPRHVYEDGLIMKYDWEPTEGMPKGEQD